MKNSSRLLSIIDPIIRTWGSLSIGTRGQFKMGTRGSVCSGISKYRLDDKSAQYLIDFTTNDTEWIDGTDIKFSVTTSPNLLPILSSEEAKGIYYDSIW